MHKNKLILPISIILGTVILGGFYYAVQIHQYNTTEENPERVEIEEEVEEKVEVNTKKKREDSASELESGKDDIEFKEKATEVGGIIDKNITWNTEKAPYLVTSNIGIEENATLTIEPGVTVAFNGEYGIQVEGGIVMEGTASNSIILKTAPEFSGNWKGIEVLNNNNKRIVIDHCEIHNAQTHTNERAAILSEEGRPVDIKNSFISQTETAIRLNGHSSSSDSEVKFVNNRIKDVRRGFWIQSWEGNIIIDNNYIEHDIHTGVDLRSIEEKVIITNNYFSSKNGTSIHFNSNSSRTSLVVSKNNFENNDYATLNLSTGERENYEISQNNFLSEGYGIKLFSSGENETSVNAKNNWWKTTKENKIQEKIYDYNNDLKLPSVNYKPFATSKILNAGPQ